MEVDERIKILERATAMLREHFDSVQVFAMRYNDDDEGGTGRYKYGDGDFYCRFGAIREWLMQEEEHMRERARMQERDDS